VALREIDPVRRLESAVQIVSRSGDMPRLKLLSGPRAARESIAQATKGGEA
jgi:hypothetical protein